MVALNFDGSGSTGTLQVPGDAEMTGPERHSESRVSLFRDLLWCRTGLAFQKLIDHNRMSRVSRLLGLATGATGYERASFPADVFFWDGQKLPGGLAGVVVDAGAGMS